MYLKICAIKFFLRKLYKIIDLEQLETGEVEVKTTSWKHVTQMACIYIFFLLLTLLFYYGYITSKGNIFILLVATVSLFVWTLVCNISVKEGWTSVKFVNKKKGNK